MPCLHMGAYTDIESSSPQQYINKRREDFSNVYNCRLLKEKLSLLSPTSSPQKKRLSPSPKLRHRATPPMSVRTSLGKNGRVSTNSPLLKTASPLILTGKVATGEEGKKTNNVV